VKAYIRTFGCRANQYDTELIRTMIEAAGGEIVGSAAEADVALYNSCAVTAEAEADLRQAIRRAPLPSIVMGCASARDNGAIAALPGVTHVIGGADLDAIAMALGIDRAHAASRTEGQTGSRALLRIQDGCDEHCTFCATTLARGANRSRPADEIVREATALARTHPEIVITGIHIGTYGVDTGMTLGELIARLVHDVPDVRFRLTSIEGTEVDAQLAELLTGDPRRVAPHLHAPLQSGSNAVLKRMGRHWYTAGSYATAVEKLAARCHPFALAADIITGFPGETDADHRATLALVGALPFTSLHVFPYSERPGTAAAKLPGAVRGDVSRARAAELRALGEAKAASHRSRRIGETADVVVIGDGAKREGLTEDYLTVSLSDASMPRRSRFGGWLSGDSSARLVAAAVTPAVTPTERPFARSTVNGQS
jgi:threonylcarbamoyladenosine tRNA methylthiotransferase MtaB